MGEHGIQETKEMLDFIIAMGNGYGKAVEDGEWTASDLTHFMDALLKVPAALANMDLIPVELGDLEEAELQELKDHVVEEFDIPQDDVEEVIEMALGIGLDIYDLIQKIREL